MCKTIWLLSLFINTCNVEKLEVSISEPEKRCIVVDTRGERTNIKLPCNVVYELISNIPNEEQETSLEKRDI